VQIRAVGPDEFAIRLFCQRFRGENVSGFVVLGLVLFLGGTAMALVRMNRLSCMPCNSADDSAYCNPPRPHRPA